MTIESWIGIVVGLTTIITSAGLGVRWLVRHYFDEIKAELKPNSGSSLKDQVTRLETKQAEHEEKMANQLKTLTNQHSKLEAKIDKLYDTLLDHIANNK